MTAIGFTMADIADGFGPQRVVINFILYVLGGTFFGLFFGYIGTVPFVGMAWLASRFVLTFPRQMLFILNGAAVGLILVYYEDGGFTDLDLFRQIVMLLGCIGGGALAGWANERLGTRVL